MDIDKQLGAITAEFWSQIGNTSTNNLVINLHQNDIHTNSLSANAPLQLQKNQADQNYENKVMEVESEGNQNQLMSLLPQDLKENDENIENHQQTLSEIIDETLSKSSKSTPPQKSIRPRKNSSRMQQLNSNSNLFGSLGALTNLASNKNSNLNNENNSVCDWLENQEKQQTLDREEKAIQRKKANNKNKKWTPQELQRLYDLLECFGTDFTTIQQYFDKKTVTQIKNKFHKEEKDNPQKIKELLFCKGSQKRLQIKLENERDFQTFQQYYIDKYLHSNLNNFLNDSSSNSSTPLQLPSPLNQSVENNIPESIKNNSSQNNQQSLISRIPACISLPSESLKIVADDIERRLLKERSNTQ
ncbi:hypothetical protein ABPG72_013690 [Tetrahymena utriculariae]